MSENEEMPDCIGNFGLYGLDCELCEWAEECIEFQMETEENGFQG